MQPANKNAKKVLILTLTMGNGHNASARTMEKALAERGAEVKVVDYLKQFAPTRVAWAADKGYSLSLAHFLKLYNRIYRRMEEKKLESRFKRGYMQNMACAGLEGLMREIDAFRPDVIFCTHIYAAMALTDLRMVTDIPAKSYLILLDYSLNNGYESSIGVDYLNLINEDFLEEAVRIGYRREQLLFYGLPGDPKFFTPIEKAEARARLGLRQELFTVMVMFGGGQWSGGDKLLRSVARALEGAPAQIVMINGRNERARRRIDRAIARGTFRGLNVVNVGFTNEVDVWMAASDVAVSKLGGLSASECIARQLPIVAAQKLLVANEAENAEYLCEKGAALTYRTQAELAALLRRLQTDNAFYEGVRAAQGALRRDGVTGLAEHILSQPAAVYPAAMPLPKDLKRRVAAAVQAAYDAEHQTK